MKHSEELFAIVAELDLNKSPDKAYQDAFSTHTKNKLRRNETWRDRLVQWAKSERQAGY